MEGFSRRQVTAGHSRDVSSFNHVCFVVCFPDFPQNCSYLMACLVWLSIFWPLGEEIQKKNPKKQKCMFWKILPRVYTAFCRLGESSSLHCRDRHFEILFQMQNSPRVTENVCSYVVLVSKKFLYTSSFKLWRDLWIVGTDVLDFFFELRGVLKQPDVNYAGSTVLHVRESGRDGLLVRF